MVLSIVSEVYNGNLLEESGNLIFILLLNNTYVVVRGIAPEFLIDYLFLQLLIIF